HRGTQAHATPTTTDRWRSCCVRFLPVYPASSSGLICFPRRRGGSKGGYILLAPGPALTVAEKTHLDSSLRPEPNVSLWTLERLSSTTQQALPQPSPVRRA